MDVVTFVEEHLGIELLPYQKKYLKWLLNQDTKVLDYLPARNIRSNSNYEDNKNMEEFRQEQVKIGYDSFPQHDILCNCETKR